MDVCLSREFVVNLITHPGKITIIYGFPGSGKTYLAHVIASALLEKSEKVAFIDSERTISISRIRNMANLPSTSNESNGNIIIFQPEFLDQERTIIDNMLEKVISERKISTLIWDSIATNLRGEDFLESGGYLIMSQKILPKLLKITVKYNIRTILTNQVTFDFKNKGIRLLGGRHFEKYAHTLVRLDRVKGNTRVMHVLQKPDIEFSIKFIITDYGIQVTKMRGVNAKI